MSRFFVSQCPEKGGLKFFEVFVGTKFSNQKELILRLFFDLFNHYNLLKGIGNVEKTFTLKVTNFNIAKP